MNREEPETTARRSLHPAVTSGHAIMLRQRTDKKHDAVARGHREVLRPTPMASRGVLNPSLIGVNQNFRRVSAAVFRLGAFVAATVTRHTYSAPRRPGLLFVAAAAGARTHPTCYPRWHRHSLETALDFKLLASVPGARCGRHKQEPGSPRSGVRSLDASGAATNAPGERTLR